jgi:hypothetical protein
MQCELSLSLGSDHLWFRGRSRSRKGSQALADKSKEVLPPRLEVAFLVQLGLAAIVLPRRDYRQTDDELEAFLLYQGTSIVSGAAQYDLLRLCAALTLRAKGESLNSHDRNGAYLEGRVTSSFLTEHRRFPSYA